MKKRPLVFFTAAFTLGILVGSYINLWLLISLFLGLILLLFLFTASRLTQYLSYSLLIFAVLLGSLSSFHTINKYNKTNFKKLNSSEVVFRAKIVSEPDIRDRKTNYIIMPFEINGEKTNNTKVLLSLYQTNISETSFSYGNIIAGSGKVLIPSHARNPGGFDYKRYLDSQGIYASIICFSGSIRAIGTVELNPIMKASFFLKSRIQRIIDQLLPANQAGLLKGMLIGDRNGLPGSVKNDFNTSGLTHIVCVSGANIAYIALSCIFILRLTGIKKPVSSIITIFVILIFMFITGCSPSVIRASIMGIMILLAEVFTRKTDIYTSISSACLIILLYNPLALYDVGFQLSFAGTIGIVLFYKTLSDIFQFLPRFINEALSATLSAQITVCPIIALYFNKLSLIALLSNILVIPATGLITSLGFVTVILGQLNLFLAQIISNLNFVLLSFVLWCAKITAEIPYASILVPTPTISFLAAFYGLSFSLLWYLPHKNQASKWYRYIPNVCTAIIIINILFTFMPKAFKVFFLDVGQGDSIFIRNSTGQTCLIDGGGTYPGSFSSIKPEDIIIPFLLDNGITNLDMAILSHPHGDHIEGLIKVIENIKVKCLVIAPQNQIVSDMKKLLDVCHKSNTQIIEARMGNRILFGDAEFRVLHPSASTKSYEDSPLNNNSLVLKLKYKNTSILFTGDIQSEAESLILSSDQDIKADILKISHHGSPYSTTLDFLTKASPSSAIISVGRNNFGHPSDSVLQKLKQNNIKGFRTDKNGCITIEINNRGYSIIPNLTN
ncbi:MAG: DNA internalization-related competence protein ComEC/Rec2 [Deltaproteobacteria bacterium]